MFCYYSSDRYRGDVHNIDSDTRLNLILREYDWLHSEIAEQIKFRLTIAVTVIVGFLAGLMGLREHFNLSLALLVTPFVLMTVGNLLRSRLLNAITLGRQIAGIEDKIYRTTNEPLLCHETRLICERLDHHPWKGLLWSALTVISYAGYEAILYKSLDEWIIETIQCANPSIQVGLLLIVVLPAFLNLRIAWKLYKVQSKPLETHLFNAVVMNRLRHASTGRSAQDVS